MPNRPDGICRGHCKHTENIWVAPIACHNDHYAESSLGYQLTLISPAHCYQKSLPPAIKRWWRREFPVSFLVFFHIISHSYIILLKFRASYHLVKSPCQILNNQNSSQIKLNLPSQVCLWNYKEKWPQFKSLIRSNKSHINSQNKFREFC